MIKTLKYLNKAIDFVQQETGVTDFHKFSLIVHQFEENIGKEFCGMDIKVVPYAMQYDFLMACNIEDCDKDDLQAMNAFKEFQQLYDRPH